MALAHVDYGALDRAKNAFIEASQKTIKFASAFGFIPPSGFGASANVFSLDLKPFLKKKAQNLYITLLPEGLGTSDDARPVDLNGSELVQFWKHIGQKTVAVMTNDAACAGMQSVLISLYLPSANPEFVFNDSFMKGFLDGFVKGCKTVGCVYFSGETPQLKNKLYQDKLDIAGAVFGLVPAGLKPLDGQALGEKNAIVLVESSGPHDNGFTSLRDLAVRLPKGYRTVLPDGREYWEHINEPTILYTPLIQAILKAGIVPTNLEPITGHGWQKLMRSKKPLRYVIEKMLPVTPIFKFIEKESGMTPEQMVKIFNYGAGLAIFVKDKAAAEKVVKIAAKQKLKAVVAGYTEKAPQREVVIRPLNITLSSKNFALGK